METLCHCRLVIDQTLPEASRLGGMRDREVRLKAHLALRSKRVGDLCGGETGRGRERIVAKQEGPEEKPGVESEGGRVEGDGLTVVEEAVSARDGVRR